jgi:hypothetical protein
MGMAIFFNYLSVAMGLLRELAGLIEVFRLVVAVASGQRFFPGTLQHAGSGLFFLCLLFSSFG